MLRVSRPSCALVVAATLLVVPGAVGSTARVDVDQPTLSVDTAVANARWKEGWLRPGAAVHIAGRVGAASSLSVALRPAARATVVTAHDVFDIGRAGSFARDLPLPPRPLPGTYLVRVTGTSGVTALAPVAVRVTIPAPPEGVLDRSLVATARTGPWLRFDTSAPEVKGPHKELWARFRFLSPPTGKKVVIVWRLRWHRLIGVVEHRYKSQIDTYVRSGTPLPVGAWTVTLTVDGRIAKRAEVRVSAG